jgi:uncharacterized tellurite resistance protein B-like protein
MLNDILNLFKQGKGTARSHMKNLIEMAAVDGNFDSDEFTLLKSIAKRNGISESQLAEIRKNPQGVKFEAPVDVTERFDQLYDLVHMMSIDKNIHQEELKLCNLFAIKFGYQREKIRELIDSIQLNIKNGQSHEEAMKRLSFLAS